MLSRRDFMRSTAAYGALAATGLVGARPAGAATTWVAPSNIPNDGSANASQALTWWLAVTGQPGDTFQLRRGPGFAPGDYWVPQGIQIHKPLTLDLNGCWLRTGTELGFDDPNIAANKVTYPAYGPAELGVAWPARRSVVYIGSSNVTIMSSLVNARIQGAARTVHYRGNHSVVGRNYPTGCAFHGTDMGGFGDGQHGIRIGFPGSFDDITIDLTNIGVEFVHGDGICFGNTHHRVTVLGRHVGASVLGGVPGPHDDQHLLASSGGGGSIAQGAGTQWIVDDPRSADRWVPDTLPLPGVHHTGRMGVSMTHNIYDVLLDGFAIWRNRTILDLELEAEDAEIDGLTVRNMEWGVRTLKAIACAGPAKGPVKNVVVENVVSYELPAIDTHQPAAHADARCQNWRIEGVRCETGVKARADAIMKLPRIDGLQVRDCHALVKGTAVGVLTDTGSPVGHVNGPSTGVVFDPAMSVQFPFTP